MSKPEGISFSAEEVSVLENSRKVVKKVTQGGWTCAAIIRKVGRHICLACRATSEREATHAVRKMRAKIEREEWAKTQPLY
ncbi:MAG: hypothetical protein WC783_05565 [Candidatus Paceibacterota bacterium]|jgi:hypothetical protein